MDAAAKAQRKLKNNLMNITKANARSRASDIPENNKQKSTNMKSIPSQNLSSPALLEVFPHKLCHLVLLTLIVATILQQKGMAQAPVNLGTTSSFAVLAGSGITNTGATTINGDVGTFPTTTITGFGTVTLNGVNHAGDAVTQQAKTDLVTAYNDAAGRAPTAPIFGGGTDLGGLTLANGVYNGSSSIFLTGTLTLDAQGDPDAVWIFQVGSTLITASGSSVSLLGGAQACHIFWQVGSSATLGTGSSFAGSILALTSITLNTGATVDGRVLARNGAVVLDANSITVSVCAPVPTPTPGVTPAPGATPAPVAIDLVKIAVPEDSRALVVDGLVVIVPEDKFPETFTSAFYEGVGIIAIEQANAQNQFLAQRLSAVRLGGRGFQAVGIESPLINDKDGKSVVDGKGGRSVMDAKDGKNILTLAPDNKWGVWVQGNGMFGKISNVSQLPNSNFESGGVFVGADYQWNEHITTGLFLGYQGTYSKYTNGGLNKINTGLFGGYVTYESGGFYSDAILTGGYSNYSTRRSIDFSVIDRTATGNFDGIQLSTYLDVGYDWKIGNFTLGPILAGQYTYVGLSPFTEQGAGSLNLQVDQQNINSLRSSVGGRVAYTWNVSKKVSLIPELRMFWQHEFLENSRNMDASLDSGNVAGFGFNTSAPERDSVFAGAGVIAQLGSDWSASCYYNVDFGRQNYFAQMVSVGLEWRF